VRSRQGRQAHEPSVRVEVRTARGRSVRAQALLADAERGLEHDVGRPRQVYVCAEQLAPDVDAYNDHASGLRIHTSDFPGVVHEVE
jgi:hypothetical protein